MWAKETNNNLLQYAEHIDVDQSYVLELLLSQDFSSLRFS